MTFLTTCGTTDFDEATICPPWPLGGPDVAEELDRIPFRGWRLLGDIHEEINNPEFITPEGYEQLFTDLRLELDSLRPNDGFEHFYVWLNQLKDLKLQLEACE
jgi:hypothetical protein